MENFLIATGCMFLFVGLVIRRMGESNQYSTIDRTELLSIKRFYQLIGILLVLSPIAYSLIRQIDT